MLRAPLDRLVDRREALAKAWLLQVIERSSFDQLRRVPVERIVREMPTLIADIVKATADEDISMELGVEVGGTHQQLASRFVDLLEDDQVTGARLALDMSALQWVLVSELMRSAPEYNSEAVVEAVGRLTVIFNAVGTVAAEEVMRERVQELEALANKDAVTGLYNQRFLQEQMGALLGVHGRYGHPFAVLLFDIDGLKQINDTHGHPAGDRMLGAVAKALGDEVRTIDTPVRIGGDEFCVLAPNQTASGAKLLAERLAAVIESVESADGLSVGISIGVSSCPEHGTDGELLIQLADEAMYRAKRTGERVVVSAPPKRRSSAQPTESQL
jgi:diguanylate cyclase (GGDEF)-like protein